MALCKSRLWYTKCSSPEDPVLNSFDGFKFRSDFEEMEVLLLEFKQFNHV